MRTLVLLFLFSASTAISWVPTVIYRLVRLSESKQCTFFHEWSRSVIWISPLLNPILYSFMSKKFVRQFKVVINPPLSVTSQGLLMRCRTTFKSQVLLKSKNLFEKSKNCKKPSFRCKVYRSWCRLKDSQKTCIRSFYQPERSLACDKKTVTSPECQRKTRPPQEWVVVTGIFQTSWKQIDFDAN